MFSNLVPSVRAEYHPTFNTTFRRLKNHNMHLDDHIDSELKVYESNLDGISFRTQKKTDPLATTDFLAALRIATTAGKPVFREGKKFEHGHWPVDTSMAATSGMGFREIIYLDSDCVKVVGGSESLMQMRNPTANAPFSAQFGRTRIKLDFSSLHCAVWGDFCSVHVDETGFVLQAILGMGGDVAMTADFLQHTLLELIWKDKLGMPDAVEIFVPNSANDFSSFGLRATAELGKNVRLSINASYNIRGKRVFSKTVVLEGEF